MRRMSVKTQRRLLRGWFKWVPVLAIPFCILFFHAWLNIQILRADYVLRELNEEARDLEGHLNNTGLAETIHEDPELLAERAALLEFVPPVPGQRITIYYTPAPGTYAPESNLKMARREDAVTPAPSEAGSHRMDAPAPVSAPVAPATAPDAAPAPTPAAAAAPVLLEIEDVPESIGPPAGEVVTLTPDAVEEPVMLDLPEDALYDEPLNQVDAGMGTLESL